MTKEQSVVEFYVTCNQLKNIIRTGWLSWNVQRERLESIAEHIYECFGKIDILINNAGVYNVPIETLDSGFNNIFQINFHVNYSLLSV